MGLLRSILSLPKSCGEKIRAWTLGVTTVSMATCAYTTIHGKLRHATRCSLTERKCSGDLVQINSKEFISPGRTVAWPISAGDAIQGDAAETMQMVTDHGKQHGGEWQSGKFN